ncbi:hypothetical protein B0H10DRAFT_1967275 [Mycena sp. CBHHK59/15]|nr:hypothetical protein B0H10DRAFT_1967275 [Mycena sp. CBHHK59/15]
MVLSVVVAVNLCVLDIAVLRLILLWILPRYDFKLGVADRRVHNAWSIDSVIIRSAGEWMSHRLARAIRNRGTQRAAHKYVAQRYPPAYYHTTTARVPPTLGEDSENFVADGSQVRSVPGTYDKDCSSLSLTHWLLLLAACCLATVVYILALGWDAIAFVVQVATSSPALLQDFPEQTVTTAASKAADVHINPADEVTDATMLAELPSVDGQDRSDAPDSPPSTSWFSPSLASSLRGQSVHYVSTSEYLMSYAHILAPFLDFSGPPAPLNASAPAFVPRLLAIPARKQQTLWIRARSGWIPSGPDFWSRGGCAARAQVPSPPTCPNASVSAAASQCIELRSTEAPSLCSPCNSADPAVATLLPPPLNTSAPVSVPRPGVIPPRKQTAWTRARSWIPSGPPGFWSRGGCTVPIKAPSPPTRLNASAPAFVPYA